MLERGIEDALIEPLGSEAPYTASLTRWSQAGYWLCKRKNICGSAPGVFVV
jgi:hypothetical protein